MESLEDTFIREQANGNIVGLVASIFHVQPKLILGRLPALISLSSQSVFHNRARSHAGLPRRVYQFKMMV